jgi:hypothetical protein
MLFSFSSCTHNNYKNIGYLLCLFWFCKLASCWWLTTTIVSWERKIVVLLLKVAWSKKYEINFSSFWETFRFKINFHKSKLFCFGDAQNMARQYADLFGCGQGQFLIRYLGILIYYRGLTIADWKLVEERLQKRLSSWKGNYRSLEKIDTH